MPDQSEIEQIARKLTAAQRLALLHKKAGRTAYAWARIPTLEALYHRGLVGRRASHGACYSPWTAIDWPLTPLGEAVRAYMESQP